MRSARVTSGFAPRRRLCSIATLLAGAWLLACLIAPRPASAAGDRIDVLQASVDERDDGYYVNAEFDFELKPRMAEALDRGLALFFAVELELTRSRWYWFDEKTAHPTLSYRLSYHALTRQYRVSTGTLQLGFPTLSEALGVMAHVRNWKVADRGILKAGDTYQAAIRMRLDTSQLPKPFQINALTSREWTLESDWKRFIVEAR